jgi:hypothetical protein
MSRITSACFLDILNSAFRNVKWIKVSSCQEKARILAITTKSRKLALGQERTCGASRRLGAS